MGKRVRLTQRQQRQQRGREAVDGSIPYPGNVNQPNRQFKTHDQYDNWEEVVNHPLPDMRHDWQQDQRDDIGFGIPEPWGQQPTVASVRVAANKAIKLAVLLLGDKVENEVVEAQAADFMLLGPEAIDRSLSRFSGSVELYAEDDDDSDDDDGDDEEGKEASTAATKVEAEDDSDDESEAEDEKEEKKAAIAAIKAKAEEAIAAIQSADESEGKTEEEADDEAEGKEAASKAAAAIEAAELKAKKAVAEMKRLKAELAQQKKSSEELAEENASDDGVDQDGASEHEAGAEDVSAMDAELAAAKAAAPLAPTPEITFGNVSDGGGAGEADERLAAIFSDDGIPEELPEPGTGQREASSKQGIKSLGGQPRQASNGDGPLDLDNVWDDAPDINDLFR